ncbi:hypothetical protein CBR_g54957 [Chara braunii]|uniref:Integrase catalytic domain-containing protein n=1 Tax=Chara braunii TaxID=69332 RepID=A0A388K7F5_CHABU|nr:hypothetical protein CBR_g54957 [Chara braunii]|eukprot:GBG65978.1 hypothetical protein CBR_g54957 [Chara braunii]
MRTQPVLSDALKCWIEVIEQYDFGPQYLKGEYNKVVDALSRRSDFSGALITEFGLADDVTRSTVEAYCEDPFMSEIIRRLEAKDKVTSVEFELVNGLLFLEKVGNKRLCVPNRESLCSLFLGECHDATGHFGFKKTATNLLQRFWWPTMMRDAKLYVETCQVCQWDKPPTQAPRGLLKPFPILERPGKSLSMDFMDTPVTSKSGMRYIYVIMDRLSKYVRLVAMPKTAKIEYVIELFKENWVRDFGLPKFIISDRDVGFSNELWKAAAVEQGTQLQMTSGNHPEANGQTKKMNRVVQHLLRHYIKPNQVDWDEKLALIASLYNNAVHRVTGVSPNSQLLTFKPRLPLGFKKTAANLLQRFWWPTMMRDAKLYVKTCQVCQWDKPRTQAPLGLLKLFPILERPGKSLSMDFMDTLVTSKSGMRYIYVIMDRFSKYARLVTMPETAKIEYVIKLFKENWARDFGLPKSIISNRDV